jgi:DNA adenine methylase
VLYKVVVEGRKVECGVGLKAPFPYFGGKSKVAEEVWSRFGDVRNYVEPFAGSLAVLLERPQPFEGVETVNDADGLLANFWRAMTQDPEQVALHAEWSVNEVDLHARHLWLVRRAEGLTDRLMADPDWYDVKAAGWWVWGICSWIGSGWCSGNGPWTEINGLFVKSDEGRGVKRNLPHLGNAGTGVNRPRAHPDNSYMGQAWEHLNPIADRLQNVRVACGDWSRVCSPSVTWRHGLTGVFLDPPYCEGDVEYNAGDRDLYHDVRKWAIENGSNPQMRIALCGYEGQHNELEGHGWTVFKWKSKGGYGGQGDGQGRENSLRERIWFSPHCLNPHQSLGFLEDFL